jgi:uncharacterized ion transporter superfamily protein YfcC
MNTTFAPKASPSLGLMFLLLLVALSLTWILPAGEFERNHLLSNLVVPNSFQYLERHPQFLGALLTALFKGFIEAASIIGFVLFTGGTLAVIYSTGAIEATLSCMINGCRQDPKAKAVFLPTLIILFSLLGALFGFSEENIVFVPLTIALGLSLGYDSLVGIAIPLVGSQVGVASAFVNPFTLGVAQDLAQVSPLSGWEYRLIIWILLTGLAGFGVYSYACVIERDPQKSLVYTIDQQRVSSLRLDKIQSLSRSHILILCLLGFSLLILIWGVVRWQWSITEIVGMWIGLALACAGVAQLSYGAAIKAFIEGMKEMIQPALLIALAQGIIVILQEGRVMDTLTYLFVQALQQGEHPLLTAQLMFWSQSLIHVAMPSGSGQAALTIPLMTPIADLSPNYDSCLSIG